MQETLSIIILVLAFIITASALVAVLILATGKNRQSNDKARGILMVTFAFEFLLGTWKIIGTIGHLDSIMQFQVLDFPEALALLCFQSWLFAYPMAILRPSSIKWKTFMLMTVPYLLIGIIYIFLPFEPITLYKLEDILHFIKEPDVLYRICTIGFFLPFSVMLPFLHIRTKEVSVSTIGIFVYTMSVICLSILLTFYILTAIPYFIILYFIIGFCNNVYLIYYEQYIRGVADKNLKAKYETAKLEEKNENEEKDKVEEEEVKMEEEREEITRLREQEEQVRANAFEMETDPVKVVAEPIKEKLPEVEYEEIGMTSMINRNGNYRTKDELRSMDLVHEQLCEAFNIKNLWKRSDLTIDILAKEIGTNKTYIQKCIKAATGFNYIEFINRERVDYIKKALTKNPDADWKKLFVEAGYTSRTTAWRNFKKITGVTPKEYVTELRNS